jgi:LDH2 family malate/lactate/ureidoglycolate dehydrogenase
MKIKLDELREMAVKVIIKNGYDKNEAVMIFETLLWAQRRGTSQGFNKLFGWQVEKKSSSGSPTVIKNKNNFVLIDANQSNNMVATNFGIEILLEKAKDGPMVVMGIKNTYNSAGALGYYTEKIAKSGLVAIMMSAADPGVSVFGGNSPIFGTNPISIAVPTKNNPVLLDMSTASLTWGDLVKYQNESRQLPEGLAFDSEGKPTTDPTKAMDGWVNTFDKSYKSSGLAMMIQILAGPLVGSSYSQKHEDCQYGSLIIALNPEEFGDKQLFINRVTEMVDIIKNSQRQEWCQEILIPGERGYRRANSNHNEIEITEELYKKMTDFISDQ